MVFVVHASLVVINQFYKSFSIFNRGHDNTLGVDPVAVTLNLVQDDGLSFHYLDADLGGKPDLDACVSDMRQLSESGLHLCGIDKEGAEAVNACLSVDFFRACVVIVRDNGRVYPKIEAKETIACREKCGDQQDQRQGVGEIPVATGVQTPQD